MANKGNPNFFTTYKGKYSIQGQGWSSNNVMLSCTNEVQFVSDCELSNYSLTTSFATLPFECRPQKLLRLPIVVKNPTAHEVVVLVIDPSGEMRLNKSYPDGVTIMFNGFSFQIAGNWYGGA